MHNRLISWGSTFDTLASCLSSIKSACTSTPMTISAPIALATSTGKLFSTPPSTSTMLSTRTGVNAPGMAMLARMARTRLPCVITTSFRLTMSAATQAKGIGNSVKSSES